MVVVDSVSGAVQIWEPCENRDLPVHLGAPRPVMVTAYWGVAPTHCMEVDRLSGAAASSPQVGWLGWLGGWGVNILETE